MIRDRNTGQLFFESEWRNWLRENGGPSFDQLTPDIIEQLNADPVFEGPQPTLTRYQTSAMQGAIQVEGKWYTNWVAVDMGDEAKAALDIRQAEAVRSDRNRRLQETDWEVVRAIESGNSVSQELSTYRQALRDIPLQSGFPWEVDWPTNRL